MLFPEILFCPQRSPILCCSATNTADRQNVIFRLIVLSNTTREETQLSILTDLALKTDIDGFEKEWEKAVKADTPVNELIQALEALKKNDEETALLLAETTAEILDSQDSEKALDFTAGTASLFTKSETIAQVLSEALRDKYLMLEPLETFISASGLSGGKVPLKEAWSKLKNCLQYTKGSFILHREYGPGEIIRVSRSSYTVDFQRSRDHDISVEALLDTTRPLADDSLFITRWKDAGKFRRLIEKGGEDFLNKAFRDMSSEGSLTEVNLFKLLEGSDVKPKAVWKTLKKAAESSQNFILMGNSITPADNSSLLSQVRAVLDMKKMPMSEKTRTVASLIKAASSNAAKELNEIFPEVVQIKNIEKGAVFEMAWLCSSKGSIDGFAEAAAHLIEKKAVRMERAIGEIHSIACRKLYLQSFFNSSPDSEQARALVHRLPRTLRDLAADHLAENEPQVHSEYLAGVLENPAETEHFMWALERAANRQGYMDPEKIVALALKNLNFAKSEGQRRICNLLMDSLRPQLEQFISLMDTRRLETLTGNLEESIGAQESGLVLLARRELSGRRTGGFTNIRKFWEGEIIYSSRNGIAGRTAELEALQTERIPAAAKDIAEAASHGDLSENAEYTAALEKRDFLLETLNRFRKELKILQPYPVGQVTAEMVCPATKVVLESMSGEPEIRKLKIVGPLDADSEAGLINYKAPLGSALLGLSKGDTVQLPGERNVKWRITDISILEDFLK